MLCERVSERELGKLVVCRPTIRPEKNWPLVKAESLASRPVCARSSTDALARESREMAHVMNEPAARGLGLAKVTSSRTSCGTTGTRGAAFTGRPLFCIIIIIILIVSPTILRSLKSADSSDDKRPVQTREMPPARLITRTWPGPGRVWRAESSGTLFSCALRQGTFGAPARCESNANV